MDKYVVVGNPIKHSKSPFIHQQFAQQTDQNIVYQKELVDLDGFSAFIQQFKAVGGKGCNVTVPFKEEAYALADTLSERARAAGAVNTLIFNADGSITGDNTDGQGLVGDLLNQQVAIKEKRILVIGAGGAARGCILPILNQSPSEVVIANRTASKAASLAQQFNHAGNIKSCEFAELSGVFDIIINSTSASLSGALPPIDESIIAQADCCYDMAYGSEETCFLTWARELGVAKTIDGLGMLVGQAAESFRIWRGVLPKTDSVLNQMRQGL